MLVLFCSIWCKENCIKIWENAFGRKRRRKIKELSKVGRCSLRNVRRYGRMRVRKSPFKTQREEAMRIFKSIERSVYAVPFRFTLTVFYFRRQKNVRATSTLPKEQLIALATKWKSSCSEHWVLAISTYIRPEKLSSYRGTNYIGCSALKGRSDGFQNSCRAQVMRNCISPAFQSTRRKHLISGYFSQRSVYSSSISRHK